MASIPESFRTVILCLFLATICKLPVARRVKRQFPNYCYPRLQPPRNGYFIYPCTNVIGSSCTVACAPGTILIGENRLVCLPDTRTWNAPLPICAPNPATTSGLLPQITNPIQIGGSYPGLVPGQTTSTGIVIGPAIGVGLQPGTYPIQGTGSTSVQIICPALSPPANGIRSGNCDRATLGTSCLFSCFPGFVLSGYPILTCGMTGQWNPQVPPMCLPQQPVYPPVYPGTIPGGTGTGGTGGTGGGGGIMTTRRPQIVVTTIIPIVIPMTTRRPTPVTCPPLISPPNGMAQGMCTNAMPGSGTCYFSCFRGFVLSGFPVLTCMPGGQWSNAPPICRGIVLYRMCGFRGVYGCRYRSCSF